MNLDSEKRPYNEIVLVPGGEWVAGQCCPVKVAGERCTGKVRRYINFKLNEKSEVIGILNEYIACDDLSVIHTPQK